jgi:two-component system LytT family sensor kinase
LIGEEMLTTESINNERHADGSLLNLSRTAKFLLWLIIWGMLGLSQAARLYFIYNFDNPGHVTWTDVLIMALPEWYVWGLFSLVIFAICKRAPFRRDRLISLAAIHISLAIILSIAQILIYNTVFTVLEFLLSTKIASTLIGFWDMSAYVLRTKMHSALLTYFLIAFFSYAIILYAGFRDNERRLEQLQSRLSQARLDALKGQLQPHFLFNTLNAITVLIHSDPDAADRMVTRLSELLRTTLDSGDVHEVELAHELELLDLYLNIQQVRFGDRLQVERQIDDAAKNSMVPYMILQPLVENAIEHGVSRNTAGGLIRISASCANLRLKLCVADNGPGMTTDHSTEESGYGLDNTKKRLQTLYGNDAAISIGQSDLGGTDVTLTFPSRQSDGEV